MLANHAQVQSCGQNRIAKSRLFNSRTRASCAHVQTAAARQLPTNNIRRRPLAPVATSRCRRLPARRPLILSWRPPSPPPLSPLFSALHLPLARSLPPLCLLSGAIFPQGTSASWHSCRCALRPQYLGASACLGWGRPAVLTATKVLHWLSTCQMLHCLRGERGSHAGMHA